MKKFGLVILFICSVVSTFGQIVYFHSVGNYSELDDLQPNQPIRTLQQKVIFPADSADILELKINRIRGNIDSSIDFYEFDKNGHVLVYHRLYQGHEISQIDTNIYKDDLLIFRNVITQHWNKIKDSSSYISQITRYIWDYDANKKVKSWEVKNDESEIRKLTLYHYKDTMLKRVVKLQIHPNYEHWRLTAMDPGNYFENPKDFYTLEKFGRIKYGFRFGSGKCMQSVHILYREHVANKRTHQVIGSKKKSKHIKLNYRLINGVWKEVRGVYYSLDYFSKVKWNYNGEQIIVNAVQGNRKYVTIFHHDAQGNIASWETSNYKGKKLLKITKYEYQYVYDAHNNWIKKTCFENGVLTEVIERTITYYD